MIFYRIEDKWGGGLYRGALGNKSKTVNEELNWVFSERHPAPSTDKGLKKFMQEEYTKDYFFAFRSIAQLKKWIHKEKWRVALKEEGFNISIIKSKGKHGTTQSVYHKDYAEHIGYIDLGKI